MNEYIAKFEIFREACYDGNLDIVMECVIEKAMSVNEYFCDVNNGQIYKIWNPLRIATNNGNYEVVNFLLSCPYIIINDSDIYQRRALSIAVSKNFTKLFKLLILHGASIPTSMCCGLENQHIGCSINILMNACWNGNSEIVGHLVDSEKFDINTTDIYGRTALHIACEKPRLQIENNMESDEISNLDLEYNCIILLLLQIDEIDIFLKNEKNKTAYETYVENKEYIADEILNEFEMKSGIIKNTETENNSIKEYLEKLGIGHLYTDEIALFEKECIGKSIEDTIIYKILHEFVKMCDMFDFGINLKYDADSKLIQLSCYNKENHIKYSTNGKTYSTYSPQIMYEEEISGGTTCAMMYVKTFISPPVLGWGWKNMSSTTPIKNIHMFRDVFSDYLLQIT